ncbi:phage tail termination protein [Nocardia amamiensis]|uniref:phage tail termination protein n=1 Tax=Nocardia TaxID=1817 RepID=UPI0033F3BAD0
MSYPVAGEFPDFEQFMIDLFTPIASTVATLPATASALQSALPLIWVRKTGGTLDINAITYKAKVNIVAFGTSRTQAQQLATQIRTAMLGAPSTRVNGVLIDYAEEVAAEEPKFHPPMLRRGRGLTEVPDLDPLGQMVEVAFSIEARRQ